MILEKVTLKNLENNNLIDINGDNIQVNFKDSNKIFRYGKTQIDHFNPKQQELLNLLAKGMIKPVPEEEYQQVVSNFSKPLPNYLKKAQLMSPIQARETIFYSSPKIYKYEDNFRKLLENDEYDGVPEALDFINQNPGIPMDSIDSKQFEPNLLKGLTLSGALDSINLDVEGVSSSYLLPSNLNADRFDQDHLDQVKLTLANFRFGESYPQFRLRKPEIFLEKLLNDGYAGNATPIGTDYRNLELAGIVSVEKVNGNYHRLWMLKKDVIEDTLKVFRGSIPIISRNPDIDLNGMDNAIISRMMLDHNNGKSLKEVTDALRGLQRGIL